VKPVVFDTPMPGRPAVEAAYVAPVTRPTADARRKRIVVKKRS
jgi:hypothetical protein